MCSCLVYSAHVSHLSRSSATRARVWIRCCFTNYSSELRCARHAANTCWVDEQLRWFQKSYLVVTDFILKPWREWIRRLTLFPVKGIFMSMNSFLLWILMNLCFDCGMSHDSFPSSTQVQGCLTVTEEIEVFKSLALVIAQIKLLKRRCGVKCAMTSNWGLYFRAWDEKASFGWTLAFWPYFSQV